MPQLEDANGRWREPGWPEYLRGQAVLWDTLLDWSECQSAAPGDQWADVAGYAYAEGGWPKVFRMIQDAAGKLLSSGQTEQRAQRVVDILCAASSSRDIEKQAFLAYQTTLDRQLGSIMRELREHQKYRAERDAVIATEESLK